VAGRTRGRDPLEEFVLELHGCLTLREVQGAFMHAADRLLPARAHGIYELDGDGLTPLEVQTRGVSDAFLSEYEARGRSLDPVFGRVATTHEPVSSDLAWSGDAWRAQPFYEVLGHGDIHHLVQAPLVVEGRLVGTLNVASPLGAPAFGPAEVARLRRVARHVSVAYGRARRVDALERRCTTAEELLDALGVPLLAHTAEGALLYANRAADRLLATPLGAGTATALRAALRRNAAAIATRGSRVATETVVVVPEQGDGSRWRPRPARPQGACTALAVRTTAVRRAPEVLASFVYEAPTALPAALPGLSPREQEVVELVVRGLSNRAIAEAASISENTVKQHLKRVYAKLGVHSRAEAAAAAAWAAADGDAPFAPDQRAR
jgi:DNA-binding CsgD family transcriptional regulator/PAS domain-containing protein